MSSFVTGPECSVSGKITRSGLETRTSRPSASTTVASDVAMPGVLRQLRALREAPAALQLGLGRLLELERPGVDVASSLVGVDRDPGLRDLAPDQLERGGD